jgi:hypothetical protein
MSHGDGGDDGEAKTWQQRQQLNEDGNKVIAMGTQSNPHDDMGNDDIPSEIDFSKGVRGKFFKPGARMNLPVYLEAEVQDYLTDRARARGIDVAQLVNELLKKDIELIEAAR